MSAAYVVFGFGSFKVTNFSVSWKLQCWMCDVTLRITSGTESPAPALECLNDSKIVEPIPNIIKSGTKIS